MIFGNPEHIAVVYEVLHRHVDEHFVFGIFNIYIADRPILEKGSNWTLNCLISHLKSSADPISTKCGDETSENLYRKACESRGYWLHDTPRFDDTWWSSEEPETVMFMDRFVELLDRRKTHPPAGTELELYCELLDKGWRFFVYTSESGERLIYSNDQGKTVFEHVLPNGATKSFLLSLPEKI